jgi:hypothetical protein
MLQSHTRQEFIMQGVAAKPVKLTIPAEVQAFAQDRGLAPHLPALVAVLQRVFHDATRASVEVHEDPDIAGLRSLLFEVEVPWSQEQWRAGMKAWRRETAAVCPSQFLTEFGLVTYRRPA